MQLSGFGIVAIGIWTIWDKYHYVALLATPPGTYAVTTYLLLGTGGLIVLVGFLGCCGAWRENRFCLMTVRAGTSDGGGFCLMTVGASTS